MTCDVAELPTNGRKALERLCRKAGVAVEEVKFVWALVPCETCSPANWSNYTRGNRHREKTQGHLPREDDGEKAQKAKKHDQIVRMTLEMIKALGKGALENLAGRLKKQGIMAAWERERKTVHLCNFGWPYKKTMDIWA